MKNYLLLVFLPALRSLTSSNLRFRAESRNENPLLFTFKSDEKN